MFDIIDSEECFSKDLVPYSLIKGEFDVCDPYFRSKAQETLELPPSKKRKKKNSKPPSVADIETQERHQEIIPRLLSCIRDIQQVWPTRWKDIKIPATNLKDVERDTIDFPSIQAMVETAHDKFGSSQHMEKEEKEEENTVAEYLFNEDIIKNLDLFSIFNLVCINAENKLRLLQITPTCQYIIPHKSTFLMGSMANSTKQLGSYVNKLGGADLIVMDPPWPNKSVTRSSHYETQDIYDLYSIPIRDMISSNCIVAIWVTNKPKFRRFIIDKLFPSWNLECVSEWIWLKVTTQGECIFPIDSLHKKPYEQLIIGRPIDGQEQDTLLPKWHTIVSIPSVRHSRKPPLQDVLMPYMNNKKDPICVELFARCLTPGWISWGNECLKFQHLNYFDKQQEDVCT